MKAMKKPWRMADSIGVRPNDESAAAANVQGDSPYLMWLPSHREHAIHGLDANRRPVCTERLRGDDTLIPVRVCRPIHPVGCKRSGRLTFPRPCAVSLAERRRPDQDAPRFDRHP